MRAFLPLLLLVPALGLASPAANRSSTGCEGDLRQAARDEVITKLFQAGLDDEDRIAAYTGLTHTQMLQLVENGRVAVAEQNGLYPVSGAGHDAAAALAKDKATRLSARALVHHRVRSCIGVNLKAVNLVTPIVDKFMDDKNFEPVFEEILAAVKDMDFGAEERLSDAKVEQKLKFELGEDNPLLPSYRKVRVLLKLMGFSSEGLELIASKPRESINKIFSPLPSAAGYVIGLKPEAVRKLPAEITIDDIAGIDPLAQDEYEYLDGLQR